MCDSGREWASWWESVFIKGTMKWIYLNCVKHTTGRHSITCHLSTTIFELAWLALKLLVIKNGAPPLLPCAHTRWTREKIQEHSLATVPCPWMCRPPTFGLSTSSCHTRYPLRVSSPSRPSHTYISYCLSLLSHLLLSAIMDTELEAQLLVVATIMDIEPYASTTYELSASNNSTNTSAGSPDSPAVADTTAYVLLVTNTAEICGNIKPEQCVRRHS